MDPLLSISNLLNKDCTYYFVKEELNLSNPLINYSWLITPSLFKSNYWNNTLYFCYYYNEWRCLDIYAKADIWNLFYTLNFESFFNEIFTNYLEGVLLYNLLNHSCSRAYLADNLSFTFFFINFLIKSLQHYEIKSQGYPIK